MTKPPDTPWDWTRRASAIVRALESVLEGRRKDRRPAEWATIAAAHGYPSVDAMRENVEQLKRFGDQYVTFAIPYAPTRKAPPPRETPGPVECECGRKFARPQALVLHRMRSATHQQPKTHDCPDCGRTYKKRTSLAQHRLIVHEATRPGGKKAS